MSDTHNQVRDMIKSFYPFAKKRYGFDRAAKIVLNQDAENSSKPLGKTAYYDPQNNSVTVYTHNRHPKDIMRSISHELVHHTQNCRGDLSNVAGEQGQGYAQENDHLREMEREAYEQGNLCFRDWEDGIKSNLEPGTIYEKRNTNMATIKDHLKSRDANLFERVMDNFGYKSKIGEGVDAGKQLWMQKWQEAAGNPQPPPQDFWDTAMYAYRQGKDPVEAAKDYMSHRVPDEDPMDDFNYPGSRHHYQEANEGGEGVHDIFNMPEPEAVEPTGNPKEDALRQIVAQSQAAKVDGVMVDGYTASAIVQVLDAIRPDVKEKYLASPIHIMAKLALSQVKEGKLKEELGSDPAGEAEANRKYYANKAASTKRERDRVQGNRDESEALKQNIDMSLLSSEKRERGGSTHYLPFPLMKGSRWGATIVAAHEELYNYVIQNVKDDDTVMGQDCKDCTSDGSDTAKGYEFLEDLAYAYKTKDTKPINHPTQAQKDSWESDYRNESKVKEALKRVFKKNPALIEVAKKADLKKLAERFRDSPEEKEMTSKMSNKEFSDYHTRDKHLAPDLKGDMGEIPGMEGPFQYASGAVLYYDPKAGKYYDRGKDMYIDDEEASQLTMNEGEGDQFVKGDHVQDDRTNKAYVVVEPMAGGAVVENEEGKIEKIRSQFLSKVEGAPQIMKEGDFIGHHAMIDGEYYVDSNFLNKLNKIPEMGSLDHMGFGDFSFNSQDGKEMRFSRSGQDIPGQVGRSHKVYAHPPEFIEEVVAALESAGHTTSETEALPQGEPTMQNETIARKLKELLEGKKIKKAQVAIIAQKVAAKLLEGKYKRDDEETEDKDEKEDLEESGSACGGAPEAIKLKVDRDGDEPGDLPGDGLEPVEEKTKKDLADRKPTDTPADRLKAQEGKSKQTHYKRDGNDESATIDPEKDKDEDKEESKTEGKLPPALQAAIDKKKGKDGDADDDKDDDKDEKEDLDEKTKKDVADRKPSDTPQDRLKPLEERGYGRGNEEPGSMFDPYENEEDEYSGGYGGEEDELAQYKDLLAALEGGGPVDGSEAPADIQAQMDAEFGGGEEDEEEDPFGDPLKEWWDIRNARRTEKFMSWAIPKKK